MIIPLSTPSGRPIPRGERVRSFHDLPPLIARDQVVHPTMMGVSLLHRDDIALVPIHDLLPIPLGLIWCTAYDNARIQAVAAVARSLTPRPPVVAQPGA
jgi:hypothetical protein